MLGILGGMGPEAGVDFAAKLTKLTIAERDQQHMPFVLWSVPQIPDRTSAIIGRGESPLPQMLRGLSWLHDAGATVAVIPCNTAHYWHDDLSRHSPIPILHIVDAVQDAVAQKSPGATRIGLMATAGTIAGQVYQNRTRGLWKLITLGSDAEQRELSQGIALAKAGRLTEARLRFDEAADRLRQAGAEVLVLGCTEIPLAPPAGDDLIDATSALAARCVDWYHQSYLGVGRAVPAFAPAPTRLPRVGSTQHGL